MFNSYMFNYQRIQYPILEGFGYCFEDQPSGRTILHLRTLKTIQLRQLINGECLTDIRVLDP